MPKPKTRAQLTRLEFQIMQVLWMVGPSTVQTVQQNLPGERLAYTTVQTMLNILERKGKVKRRLLGRAFEYRAVLSRDNALREATADILDRMFGGSVEAFLMSLLKSRQLDAGKLAKVQELIDRYEKKEAEDGHERD